MKKMLLLFPFIFLQFLLIAQIQEVYSKVKITIQNPSQAVQLLENGINMENIAILKNQSFTVELSNSEILKLNTLDIPYEVIISNMAEYYQKRNLYISIDSINNMIRNSKTLPTQFHLGSIGGFLSLPEIYSDIHLMAQLYPQLISDYQESQLRDYQ